MVKKFIERGYAEVAKIVGLFLTAGAMIIAITLFIADRPTRAEVREIIDKNVGQRIERLEKQADNNATKIDDIHKMMIEQFRK